MAQTFRKLGFAVLITVLSIFTANAQSTSPKITTLLNTASWCHVCRANVPRIEKDLMPMMMQDKNVQVVVNDRSNKNTKKASYPILEKAGIIAFANNNKATGMIYFLDANTKELLSRVSMSKSNEEIMTTYKTALSKIKN